KTSVPSSIVITFPGPCNNSCHSGPLICLVIFIGSDHVCPSSSLLANINCPVSSGSSPGPEAVQALSPGMPWVHSAATQIVPVSSSTSMEGPPIPFWASGKSPHSPISSITCISSPVRPPSVLLLIPTSVSPCRSPASSYLISYAAMSVPSCVVTKPGIRYVWIPSSSPLRTTIPILFAPSG